MGFFVKIFKNKLLLVYSKFRETRSSVVTFRYSNNIKIFSLLKIRSLFITFNDFKFIKDMAIRFRVIPKMVLYP